ncbi:Abi family protein [Neolewinella lacunae]|uniref:Abi family protein n=1 Tax=Neolewinella lacunae TaxID=1517758 RepID=A0A923T8E1_9BACT|nr:Abi family protein [Neolewinella lacunae]MBC6993853.1 Abi family protein [Neolewinella lacunae]MDN3637086.1 Abi family protein [Neolewinella lacunae]
MLDTKRPISIADQIALLRSRGMLISDEQTAQHFLRNVSYYRLAGYWWSDQEDRLTHRFRLGTSLEQVVLRYNFDRELRLIIMNMIERIEVGIRTRLIYELSLAYGAHWFEEPKYFFRRADYEGIISSIRKEVGRSKEIFIVEHQRKYILDHRCPPAWKSFEVLTMGALSKIYESLRNELPEKDRIARDLGLGRHTLLKSWLQAITVVRNICAHHSRLYDRVLPIRPILPHRTHLPWVDNQTIDSSSSTYAILCCLQYLLQTISPGNRFPQRMGKLLEDYPTVGIKAMGMPIRWKEEPLWQ